MAWGVLASCSVTRRQRDTGDAAPAAAAGREREAGALRGSEREAAEHPVVPGEALRVAGAHQRLVHLVEPEAQALHASLVRPARHLRRDDQHLGRLERAVLAIGVAHHKRKAGGAGRGVHADEGELHRPIDDDDRRSHAPARRERAWS